ncbi:MAG: metal-dependent transcriptional regulator [Calditrichaeota bacterium]|nr:metal-dependent transcriptional regulator [Calditrichota bacterium]
MITQAIQDYLKIIFKLTQNHKPVSTNAIAERLCVSQASVTGMLKKLSELKLIKYKRYHGVELTAGGRRVAIEIIRHHRLLELYLAEALGYSWDQVHDEAEKLEHHISEAFEERMAAVLGNPSFDPHGAPIPTRSGEIALLNLVPLTNAEPGQNAHVRQVSDSDPKMLRYLGEIGIYPDVQLDVLSKAPFGGPLHIRIGGVEHHLGEALTDQIFIASQKTGTGGF